MLYCWQCKSCKKQIEVVCKIDDRDLPPQERCECGERDFVRLVTGGTGFLLLGKGWFRDGY